jgi:hypothetical protein
MHKLVRVAKDSCVIFPSSARTPEAIISMLQTKDLAHADLAATCHRVNLEASKPQAKTPSAST